MNLVLCIVYMMCPMSVCGGASHVALLRGPLSSRPPSLFLFLARRFFPAFRKIRGTAEPAAVDLPCITESSPQQQHSSFGVGFAGLTSSLFGHVWQAAIGAEEQPRCLAASLPVKQQQLAHSLCLFPIASSLETALSLCSSLMQRLTTHVDREFKLGGAL